MLTEHEMTHEDMQKAVANGALCVRCQERVSVAWGGAYGVNSYVLKCSNKEHTGITRHDKAEENKRKEYFSMDSPALQTMTENQMVQRVDMARFPQELTPADKRLLAQVAITYGFDPLMGEVSIYEGRPYVSIDGRYRKAQETGRLDGVDTRPATKKEREDWQVSEGDWFFKSEVYVKDASHPFIGWGRVRDSETKPGSRRQGDTTSTYKPIQNNPQRMAEKRAEAQALRKAFHIPLPSIEDIGTPEDAPTVRVVNVTTGEITEQPLESHDASPAAQGEASAPQAVATAENGKDFDKMGKERDKIIAEPKAKGKPGKLPEFKTAAELWNYALTHGYAIESIKAKTGFAYPLEVVDLKETIKKLFPD